MQAGRTAPGDHGGGVPPALRIDVAAAGDGSVVVTLEGDIDLDGQERVAAALTEGPARGSAAVVVDLRGCTFMGSTGARLLLQARDRAVAAGRRFSLRLGDSPARRVFDLLGVEGGVDILDPPMAEPPGPHIDPQALSASVDGLASVAAGPTSLEEGLGRVMQAARRLFAVSGAGLMMVGPDGTLRYVVATDPAAAALESAQEELGEGPCVDAFVLAREVRADDLGADPRYPRLAERVVPMGVRAVLGIPSRVGGTPIGSLNVFRDTPYAWDDSDAAAIAAYNGLIESLLVTAIAARKSDALAARLQEALDRRVVIERAVGVLMGRHGVDAVPAFNALRATARERRQAVADLAAEVLEGADIASLSDRPRS